MPLSNNPKRYKAIDAFLAKEFRDYAYADTPSAFAITDIAIVGGLVAMDERTLMNDDIRTIGATLEELTCAGFPVVSNPKYAFWNLIPPIQNNFLSAADPACITPDHQAQLIILCGIPFRGAPIENISQINTGFHDFSSVYKDIGIYRKERLAGVTPEHRNRMIWVHSAHNIGAQIVVTRGGTKHSHTGGEICTDQFVIDPRFQALAHTHDCYRHIDGEIPGHLGFVARKDYLEKVSHRLNRNHRLGRVQSMNLAA